MSRRKLAIVGSGNVGMSLAFAALMDGAAEEIAIIGRTRDRAVGEVMDLSHGAALLKAVEVKSGGYAECADADVVAITAGVKQLPGESRLELAARNIALFEEVVAEILKHNPTPILVIVTNPVDILTYVAVTRFGLSPQRVIGSGTVLDSARLRHLIGRAYKVDPADVNAYVLGEHGDSQVVPWSIVTIGGVPLSRFQAADPTAIPLADLQEMVGELVRDAASFVIEFKGSTYYAIGIATLRIVRAIFRDENAILSVSTVLAGQYDLPRVALALPCVVNAKGRDRILSPLLTKDEEEALRRSASAIGVIIDTHVKS